jgi:7-carboxy-7-deazaguanine synthase
MELADIRERVLALETPLVEITGGEPLEQPLVVPLMQQFLDAGKTVLLETSGAIDIAEVPQGVHIILDLKCPDSGECERNLWANLDCLKPTDEIKFVVASERDWYWTEETVRSRSLDTRFQILVSPVFGVDLQQLAKWVLDSRLNVRMQLQLHKYIWDPAARGV